MRKLNPRTVCLAISIAFSCAIILATVYIIGYSRGVDRVYRIFVPTDSIAAASSP